MSHEHIHITKEKIPKGFSYILKSSYLIQSLKNENIETNISLNFGFKHTFFESNDGLGIPTDITLQDNYFYHKNIYFNYPQGMKDYLVEINQNSEIINSEVIHIQGKEADIIVEVVLQWCSDRPEETFFNTLPGLAFYREWQYRYGEESQEIIEDAIHLLSFANYTCTFLQGTHVDGVKQVIVQSFHNICSKVNPDRELQPTWTKLASSLTGVVSVMLPRPEFEGPIKWKLANPEATNIMSNLVESHLSQYLEAHPQMIDQIVL